MQATKDQLLQRHNPWGIELSKYNTFNISYLLGPPIKYQIRFFLR